jgi:hypothetical protein
VYCICTVFTLLRPFTNTSPLPLVPALPPTQGRTCSALLFSDFVVEKNDKTKNMSC